MAEVLVLATHADLCAVCGGERRIALQSGDDPLAVHACPHCQPPHLPIVITEKK